MKLTFATNGFLSQTATPTATSMSAQQQPNGDVTVIIDGVATLVLTAAEASRLKSVLP